MKETLEAAKYKYSHPLEGGTHVLLNEDGKAEVWFENQNHASYGLIWEGKHLEFARDASPEENLPATHVKRLNSIEKLEAQGFKGSDVSLDTSIFEYGLAWRELPESNEILFVYRHPAIAGRFDRVTLSKDLDVRREFNWVNWENLRSFQGGELNEAPLEEVIRALVAYYGEEEIFGSSLWEGFSILEN